MQVNAVVSWNQADCFKTRGYCFLKLAERLDSPLGIVLGAEGIVASS